MKILSYRLIPSVKILIVLVAPLVFGFISLFTGAYDISFGEVLRLLLYGISSVLSADQINLQVIPEYGIIWDLRIPRVFLSFIVGASLAGAGTVFQAILKNPLVDPYILGISAGAAFGCAISIGFLEVIPVQVMAFIFGVLAVFIAFMLARTQGEISRLPLVLSGVIVSALFTSGVSMIKFLIDPHRLQSIVYWLMGSFTLADWKGVKTGLLGLLLGMGPVFLMRWRLNVLSLGEEEAKLLGINVKRDRFLFIGFAILSVAVATSLCGIIGWVGLIVPHLIRMFIGADHKILVPLSITGGGAFMIVADTIARNLTSFDIPVGIITAILGAPFFVYLMQRGGKEAWGK